MPGTVHVAVAGPEVSELVGVLSDRGLAVTVVEGRDCCDLEIAYADPDERLHAEVGGALRDWLADGHTPLVLQEASRSDFVLRPAGE